MIEYGHNSNWNDLCFPSCQTKSPTTFRRVDLPVRSGGSRKGKNRDALAINLIPSSLRHIQPPKYCDHFSPRRWTAPNISLIVYYERILYFVFSRCHFCHPLILLALITYPNNVRWLLEIIKLATVYFVPNLATSSSSGQNAFLVLLFWYTFNISLLSYFLKVTNCPRYGRDNLKLYGAEYDRCKNMNVSFPAERLKGVCSSLGLPLAHRESTLGWSVRLLDHLDGSHVRTRIACYRPDVWPVTACPRVFVQVQLLHYVLQRDHIQRMASKTGVNSTSARELSSGACFMQN
jgi:hypothetical protein